MDDELTRLRAELVVAQKALDACPTSMWCGMTQLMFSSHFHHVQGLEKEIADLIKVKSG
jgi:hypothetical protein